MERRGPSHLGPYGQACINCFKSKCRCVARPDGPGCQRCHRLKKDCEPSNPERRQNLQKKKDSDTRLAQLEAKLDGLISRLGPREALDDDHITDTIHADQRFTSVRARRKRGGRLTAQAHHPESLAESPDCFATETEEPETFQPDSNPAPEDEESDDNVLYTFRSCHLPHFPFVRLPPGLGAHQLRAERPLFFRSIECVSSRRHERSQYHELRRPLSEAMLEEETDRMDLLLALMTYLSWGREHSRILSRLTLQAVSLACEIMHTPPTDPGGMDAPEVRAIFLPGPKEAATAPKNFLEHHRAILGCFVLSSAVSSHLNHRIDALRWTQQMGEGLAALAANRDCPTDVSFARQVRLQFLAQEAVHIRQQCQLQTEQSSGGIRAPPGKTPAATALVSLETLEGELQTFRVSSSLSNISTNRHLVHIWATDLEVNESRYAVGSIVPFMVSHFTTMAMSSGSEGGDAARVEPPRNGERARYLWQCVKAAKACIDVLLNDFENDPAEFANIALLQWIQLSRSLDVLHYLTFRIEDPSWDRAAVPAVVNVGDMLDRVSERLEAATRAILEESGADKTEFFNEINQRIRAFCTVLRDGGLRREPQAGRNLYGHSEPGGSNPDLFHIPLSDFVT